MNISKSPFSITILYILLTQLFSLTSAQPPDFRSYYCSPTTGNYTTSTAFATNLATFLTAITTTSAITGSFQNLTVGDASSVDQVYGIALCRGDVSFSDCRSCLSDADKKITEVCPNQKEAVGWYNNCMVRYSNSSFLGQVDDFPLFILVNTANVSNASRRNKQDLYWKCFVATSSPLARCLELEDYLNFNSDSFDKQLGSLLRSLEIKAASGDSSKKFADGSARVTDFLNVYALVECTPDLSVLDCANCLEGGINRIPSCCGGKRGALILNPSCNLRFEIYHFYNADDNRSLSPPASPPKSSTTNSSSGNRSKRAKTVIVVTVSIGLCIVLGGLCCRWCWFRRNKWEKVESSSVPVHEADEEISTINSLQFDFGTIKAATLDFSDANKLGRGGFGAVYKGILSNGQQVAVKRLAKSSGQGETEFKNEVLLVAKLQHRNLARLLGFCLEREERILVYEYVPNRSLDYFLFDPEKRGYLDWQIRYKIITGIARGLLYLHEDSRLRIIHRDLKPSNILLDEEMIPKISDFGMARLFQVDQTQGDTNRVVGTYGYMAPEYALHGLFSVKSDVYSFGVLILELITGRKSLNFCQGENSEDLLSWVWRNWREGSTLHVIDETISACPKSDIIRCIHIGLSCVQDDATDRPTMSSIVIMLSSDSFTLPVVSHPAYITHSLVPLRVVSEDPSSKGAKSVDSKSQSSINEDSASQILPR